MRQNVFDTSSVPIKDKDLAQIQKTHGKYILTLNMKKEMDIRHKGNAQR